jgi:hypothetical protein
VNEHEGAKLNELNYDEMWDVACSLTPGITREQFDKLWSDFQEQKAKRRMQ